MKTNDKLNEVIKLKKLLEKYIYLNDKIQNEIVHADTLMLFRETEIKIKNQCDFLNQNI